MLSILYIEVIGMRIASFLEETSVELIAINFAHVYQKLEHNYGWKMNLKSIISLFVSIN